MAGARFVAEISVIIPCFNEASSVARVLDHLLAAADPKLFTIIAVNDGSTDNTLEILKAYSSRITLLSWDKNRGYGIALRQGIRAAKTPWVATFDADNQHRVEDLVKLAGERANFHAVIGVRDSASKKQLSRRFGKYVLRTLANAVVGQKIPDINCGLRLLRREVMLRILPLTCPTFSFSTSTLLCLLFMNYEVNYVQVTTRQRIGKSSVSQARDGFQTILIILSLAMLFNPLLIYFKAGIVCILLGLFYQFLMFLDRGPNIADGAVITILSGLGLIAFSLIADQIAAIRKELTGINRIGTSVDPSPEELSLAQSEG